MTEPVYIAQTAEPEHLTPEGLGAWYQRCIEEGRARGCTFGRFSVDDHTNVKMALVEGWVERPEDQGEIRWQMTTTANQREGENNG